MRSAAEKPMPLTLPNLDVLPDDEVREALAAYHTDCPAVLALYDATNPGPHDELLPIDILAVNALNAFGARVPPMTPMTAAWERRQAIGIRAAAITRTDLEQLSAVEIETQLPLLRDALIEIDEVRGFGSTASTKLLHRLRPNIAPIWDSRVADWYPEAEYQDQWVPWLRRVFSDVLAPENRACLELARQELPQRLPLQRVWDILLWQLGARAEATDA
jgi:Family of unknown function (DUF6308)